MFEALRFLTTSLLLIVAIVMVAETLIDRAAHHRFGRRRR